MVFAQTGYGLLVKYYKQQGAKSRNNGEHFIKLPYSVCIL